MTISTTANHSTSNLNYNTTLGAVGANGTYTITGTGVTSGQFLTSNGSNGISYTNNTTGYTLSPHIVVNNNPSSLEVKGKIVHNGRDLEERLSVIEKVLMIPERNTELEKKYPKLKKMYDAYINELSKYQMWEDIKGDKNERSK